MCVELFCVLLKGIPFQVFVAIRNVFSVEQVVAVFCVVSSYLLYGLWTSDGGGA